MNTLIDHTLLRADATKEEINKLCLEAKQYEFASVCVNSCWVSYCKKQLVNTKVNVCSVVGFPLGAMCTRAKAYEAQCAIEDGGDEIDMVMNIGAMKEGNDALVLEDIKAVVEAVSPHCVKVILETALLNKEEIHKACQLCVEAKATFVKTSSGFSTRGATLEDVTIMKKAVGEKALIKAAGGVRNREDLKAMVNAGAKRIGTSSGVALMKDEKRDNTY